MAEIRLTEDQMKGFTYVLWWPEQNIKYYGVRYANRCRTSDMGRKYFSSSKKVKDFWKEHGDPVIIIDQMFTEKNDARDYEEWMLKSNDVCRNDTWLNLSDRHGPPIQTRSGKDHHSYGKKKPEMCGDNNVMRRPEVIQKLSGENNIYYGRPIPHLSGDKHPMRNAETVAKKSGRNHHFYDDTVRVYRHEKEGEFIGTQYQLKKAFNIDGRHMSSLIKGERNSIKGWTYHGIYQPET